MRVLASYLFVLWVLCFAGSCTLEKRVYNKGFTIQRVQKYSGRNTPNSTFESVAIHSAEMEKNEWRKVNMDSSNILLNENTNLNSIHGPVKHSIKKEKPKEPAGTVSEKVVREKAPEEAEKLNRSEKIALAGGISFGAFVLLVALSAFEIIGSFFVIFIATTYLAALILSVIGVKQLEKGERFRRLAKTTFILTLCSLVAFGLLTLLAVAMGI